MESSPADVTAGFADMFRLTRVGQEGSHLKSKEFDRGAEKCKQRTIQTGKNLCY